MSALSESILEAMRGLDYDAERNGTKAALLGDLAERQSDVSAADADELMSWAGSLSRGRLMVRLFPIMRMQDWWPLLRDNWSDCDDLAAVKDDLHEILDDAGVNQLMLAMSRWESKVWHCLPDVVTVYRGCYDFNSDGLSWSLSRKVAEKFPTLARYRHPTATPLLLIGEVRKTDLFLKLGRREREVVSSVVSVVSENSMVQS